MFAKTLPSLLAAACLTLSATTAQAQSPLNPFNWFAPQPAYGIAPGGCANGQCNVPRTSYCPSGNCATGNCPNGVCRTGTCVGGNCNVSRYAPNYGPNYAPNYGPVYPTNAYPMNNGYGYPSAYRAPVTVPQYGSQPANFYRPSAAFDRTIHTAQRPYAGSNSPFYP